MGEPSKSEINSFETLPCDGILGTEAQKPGSVHWSPAAPGFFGGLSARLLAIMSMGDSLAQARVQPLGV
jgi:hypothetical protein